MPSAAEVVKRLQKLDLPSPPPELIALIRGRRERVAPELKALAVIIAIEWNKFSAEVVADEHDHLSRRKAMKADQLRILQEVDEAFRKGEELPKDVFGIKTHISKQKLLEQESRILVDETIIPAFHKKRAVAAMLYGEGNLRKRVRPRGLKSYRFIDYDVISPNTRDTVRSDWMQAWERFEQWKAKLKGGGVSIAAELAGVSRAAASKWLQDLRDSIERFIFEEEERSDEVWQSVNDEWRDKARLNPNVPPPTYPPPTFSSQIRKVIYAVYIELTGKEPI